LAKKALLVIDMLNDFIHQEGSLYIGKKATEIILPIQKRIENFRRVNDPIFYINDSHLDTDREFDLFPSHCIKGTWGAEVIAELKPEKADIIIHKRRYSGFFQTDLDLALREKSIRQLVLVGVCTNICILYTAASARMLDYQVIVWEDAVASFDQEAHNFALQQMKKILGVLIK